MIIIGCIFSAKNSTTYTFKNEDISQTSHTSEMLETRLLGALQGSQNDLKVVLADISLQYGISYEQFTATIECESNFRPDVVGDFGHSYGICQFKKATFDMYCEGDYYSSADQILCMADMFKRGLAYHWTCWKTLYL